MFRINQRQNERNTRYSLIVWHSRHIIFDHYGSNLVHSAIRYIRYQVDIETNQ